MLDHDTAPAARAGRRSKEDREPIPARATYAQIAAIKPSHKRRIIGDEMVPNLFMTVEPSGSKKWKYNAAVIGQKGVRYNMTLGAWPDFGPADAREWAMEANRLRARGIDPVAHKREQQAANRAERDNTVEKAVTDWLDHKRLTKQALGSLAEYRRMLNLNLLNAYGTKPIKSLTKGDVREAIRVMQRRGSSSAANRFLTLIGQFLRWCMEEDLITENPAEDLSKTDEKSVGSRELSVQELALAYRAADMLDDDERDAVRLMILTGTRRMEACGASRCDYHDGVWTIPLVTHVDDKGHSQPPSHSKTHREHPITLTPLARAIFDDRDWARDGMFHDAPHKFMMPDLGDKLHRAMVKLSGRDVKHFSLHGIRKGVATGLHSDEMEELGHFFSQGDVEIVLNHSMGKLVKTYTLAKYKGRIGRALAAWEELLRAEIDRQEAEK